MKSTLLHLRIPFSFFLLPVFLFAVAITPVFEFWRLVLIFCVLHFLVYPASNAYNSWFDKDTSSIGGLESPPPVNIWLYYVSLSIEAVAIVISFFISPLFAIMVIVYGIMSKAYSHPSIRLKKYPFISLIIAAVFQGGFTLLMVVTGLNPDLNLLSGKVISAALLTTVFLLGFYPITQVYQHEEDSSRGDRSMSLLLGIEGTFWFAAAAFVIAGAGFLWYYLAFFTVLQLGFFFLYIVPALIVFVYWLKKVLVNPAEANFSRTMRFLFITSLGMNVYFLFLSLGFFK